MVLNDATAGTIDHSNGYGPDDICWWAIDCGSGSPSVSFTHLDLEAGYDFVALVDGDDTDNILAELSGTTPPASSYTAPGALVII
eukprot:COSAG04_NODE_14864_length_552_cov_0.916115_1_plen_84_part_10